MWKRILVATGGSPWSDAAVSYTVELAARNDADVCLLTVLNLPATTASCDGGMYIADELLTHIEMEGKERLSKAAMQALYAGVTYTTVIKWGSIPSAILETAAEENCDLIVLGTRSLSGWKRLQVGSVANAVTAKAPQPVLLVKQAPQVAVDTPLWRRILVATGGSAWSNAALDYALALAQAQHLDVCGLYVNEPRSRRRGAAAKGEYVMAEAKAKAAVAGVDFETVIATGDIATAILATAVDKQCDAMVLGSRGLTGWKRLMVGSTANAVAAKAPLPVLIAKRFDTHSRDADAWRETLSKKSR